MDTRTCLNVALYVHCLSCLIPLWWGDFGVRGTHQRETWRNSQCIWKENGSYINGKEGRTVDSSGSGQGRVADSCDRGNEPWGVIICRRLASWAQLSGSRDGLADPWSSFQTRSATRRSNNRDQHMLIQCGKEQLDNSHIQPVHTTPNALSLAQSLAYHTSCRLGPIKYNAWWKR